MKLLRWLGLLLLPLWLFAVPAAAQVSANQLFADGVAALQKGDFPAAIDAFEALADRGFVHPDASYNRALAYIGRAQSSAERPGDLGRAAAALEETLSQHPDDEDAKHALEIVRAEVAKKRARRGAKAD